MEIKTYKCDVCKSTMLIDDAYNLHINLQKLTDRRKSVNTNYAGSPGSKHICASCIDSKLPTLSEQLKKQYPQSTPDTSDQLVEIISNIVEDVVSNME